MRLDWNRSDPIRSEEKKIWAGIRAGERKELNELFRRYYDHLFNYSIRIIDDEQAVKDAIQELFIRLWERRESLGDAKSIEAYLLSSVRRILLRTKESTQKKAEYNRAYIEELPLVTFAMEEVLIQSELHQQQKESLQIAIQSLNNRQKEALFLRYYHGLTSSEISMVMGVNAQSVRNHLARAIASLRVYLKDKNQKTIHSLSFWAILSAALSKPASVLRVSTGQYTGLRLPFR